jgi:hypothetical protein
MTTIIDPMFERAEARKRAVKRNSFQLPKLSFLRSKQSASAECPHPCFSSNSIYEANFNDCANRMIAPQRRCSRSTTSSGKLLRSNFMSR